MIKGEINEVFDSCYSKELSVCSKHTIFQRQKALNGVMELPLIKLLEKEGDFKEFLINRESDIALDIEDFGMLEGIFQAVVGREPNA